MGSKIDKKGSSNKSGIRFKPYNQEIEVELPVLLSELIKDNVLVQIVNKVVEELDMSVLEGYYTGVGCPAHHPRMMLKVWIYGYCTKVYTSRPLAQKLREDLCFMWLSGRQQPCFKTLSSFRSVRMKGMIDDLFKEVLLYLVSEGYVDLADLYLDGSKWLANNNKYKITWSKNTARYKAAVSARIDSLLSALSILQSKEDSHYGTKDLVPDATSDEVQEALSSDGLKKQIEELNELISDKRTKAQAGGSSIRAAVGELSKINTQLKHEAKKLEKYEHQEEDLAGRNSYGNTDKDATGMRMKDEQLGAGYNTQITTTNQYIVNATIHTNGSDSPTLQPHLEKMEERFEGIVGQDWNPTLTADAGYGSEENYELLKRKDIKGFVKYPLWFKEKKGILAKDKYRKENWLYHPEEDYFLCPNEVKVVFVKEITKVTQNGYKRKISVYQTISCAGCPLFKDCRNPKAKADSNRSIWVSRKLDQHKQKMKERLDTQEGKEKRSKRGTEVETPFGDIKHNMGHRRFILRGKPKVYIEFLLLAVAHNIRKVHCEKTGKWKEYYAQRQAKRNQNVKKRA